MQIATWNVNSIRTRLDHVLRWLADHPDITLLCLQETKVTDKDFPRAAFIERGIHVECYGQKSYNGVAVLSRVPLQDVKLGFSAFLEDSDEWDSQKRLITTLFQDIAIVNLYVPNGASIDSEKYTYKMAWLEVLQQYIQILKQQYNHILLCGDFNIALEDIDIHNPANRSLHVMATDLERHALRKILDLGFVDIFRQKHPEPGHFSWWDYRAAAFRRNLGWRIDYHFVSHSLGDRVTNCWIDIIPRQWQQPSDHAPVVIEIQEALFSEEDKETLK